MMNQNFGDLTMRMKPSKMENRGNEGRERERMRGKESKKEE